MPKTLNRVGSNKTSEARLSSGYKMEVTYSLNSKHSKTLSGAVRQNFRRRNGGTDLPIATGDLHGYNPNAYAIVRIKGVSKPIFVPMIDPAKGSAFAEQFGTPNYNEGIAERHIQQAKALVFGKRHRAKVRATLRAWSSNVKFNSEFWGEWI